VPPWAAGWERGNGWVFAGERATEWSANHDAELTLRTYGQVIDELEDSPQLPAEEAVQLAVRVAVLEQPRGS
jgi:hypothetical protein